MSTEIPLACTLGTDDLAARTTLIDELARDGVLERRPIDHGLRVRLRDTPAIEKRTRALIAAESRCCAFLRFALDRADGVLVLDVTGPDAARPLIDEVFGYAASSSA